MANNHRNVCTTLQTVPESQTTDHVTNNPIANNQVTIQPEPKAPAAPIASTTKTRTSSATAAAARVSTHHI